MAINTIKEVLEERNIDSLRPSDEQLEELNITLHAWNKWVKKKSDPSLEQLYKVAQFLKCDMKDLFPTTKQPVS